MNNSNTRTILEISIMAVLSTMFYLAAIYVPLIGYLIFLTPIFYAIIGIKNGTDKVFAMIIGSFFMTFMISGFVNAIILVLIGGINGVIFSEIVRHKKNKSTLILSLTGGYVLAFSIGIILVQYLTKIDLFTSINSQVLIYKDVINSTFDSLKTIGTYEESLIENMRVGYIASVDQIISVVKMSLPFLLISISALSSLLTATFGYKILRKLNIEVVEEKKYKDFRYPNHITWGTTLIVVMSFLAIKMGIINSDILSINILLIMMLVFSIQGLSTIFYYMDKKNMNKILKVIFIIVLIFLKPMLVLALLGWTDAIFDFRKINNRTI
ncbi:DUF2232 domain-containing protein [Helicovermis profundi]|uniref:DUF2232 domain-containing protein n=1 Tax=Helicovermis profundi TaxID=3065157 RepID=A0AAU9EZ63_9FIRM|nr:hypothetical protein HLPR_27410 [Clostridia bacterium S502]